MNSKFKKCLERNKIRKFSVGPKLAQRELELARNDLVSAKKTFTDKNYKWATIQLYYSMFHSARALLYKRGYREKSHQCLIEAVRDLYVEKGLLDYSLIEALQTAKILRENADYYGDFKKGNAEKLKIKAQEFLKIARKMITEIPTSRG